MAYNPFYWWRRSHKRSPLKRKDAFKGKSFLLQQIQNGDFNYSDYSNQANQEIPIAEKRVKALRQSFKGGPDSLKEQEEKIMRLTQVRINRLLEDHHNDETKMLCTLKESLIKEFKVDVWDQSLMDVGEGTLEDLYMTYQQNAKTSLIIGS